MHIFNLSKFYSIKYLLWISIFGNILAVLFCILLFIIKPIQRDLDFFSNLVRMEIYYIVYTIIIFFVIIFCIIEFLLRKINKLNTFNKLFIPNLYRSILSFIGFILIPISFCTFYILYNFSQYLWDNYFGY